MRQKPKSLYSSQKAGHLSRAKIKRLKTQDSPTYVKPGTNSERNIMRRGLKRI